MPNYFISKPFQLIAVKDINLRLVFYFMSDKASSYLQSRISSPIFMFWFVAWPSWNVKKPKKLAKNTCNIWGVRKTWSSSARTEGRGQWLRLPCAERLKLKLYIQTSRTHFIHDGWPSVCWRSGGLGAAVGRKSGLCYLVRSVFTKAIEFKSTSGYYVFT